MKRNSLLGLLFVLAMAIQAIAPAAANFAHSGGSSSDKTTFQLCLKAATDVANGEKRHPGQTEHHHDSCLFCQLSFAGVGPLAAVFSAASLAPIHWGPSAAWAEADLAPPALRQVASHRARAPPKFS